MCKRNLRFELQISRNGQNINFLRNCSKFLVFTKIVIFKYICNFLDQLLLPYKLYGRTCQEYSFIFASCEPLKTFTYSRGKMLRLLQATTCPSVLTNLLESLRFIRCMPVQRRLLYLITILTHCG